MLNSVRKMSWQKTQLWGLYKTQDCSDRYPRKHLGTKPRAIHPQGRQEMIASLIRTIFSQPDTEYENLCAPMLQLT